MIVDDGSTDNTYAVAQGLDDGDSRLALVRHARNGGVGAAMKTGYRLLLNRDCDVLVIRGS